MSGNFRTRDSESHDDGEFSDGDNAVTVSPFVRELRTFAKTGGDLWSEVLQADSLEESFKGINADDPAAAPANIVPLQRGTESYAVNVADFCTKKTSTAASTSTPTDETLTNKHATLASAADNDDDADDLFGSATADAEQFGLATSSSRPPQERRAVNLRSGTDRVITNRGQRRHNRWRNQRENGTFPPIFAGINSTSARKRPHDEEVTSTQAQADGFGLARPRSTDASSSARSHRNESAPARPHRVVEASAARSHRDESASSRHRSSKKRKTGPHSVAVLRPGYTFNTLYSTVITTNASVEATAGEISHALGEQDSTAITYAVTQVGTDVAVQLFNETVKTERGGGLRIKSGIRRRTPGGVFFELLRISENVEEETKTKVSEFSKQHMKNKQKAQKKQIKTTPTGAIDVDDVPLPSAAEALLDSSTFKM